MNLCIDCRQRPKMNHAYCRECKNRRWREYYARNRDKRRAHSEQWRQDHPDLRRSQIDRMNEQYAANPPSSTQRQEKYRRSLDAHLMGNARRRARKLGQFIENVDPQIVYQMHGGMCGICKEFVSQDAFEVDHVIPISKGGMHGYVNVQPAHPSCNQSKGAKIL